jgi:hypothetical protein
MALIRGEQLENNIQLTGSLYGTSSYALTASYVANANFNTGSFATTGSNTFSGSQTITGSNGRLIYTGTTPGVYPALAEIHANNDYPWLHRFYNDTFSTSSAIMAYFGQNDGRFVFHNESTQSIGLQVNGYNAENGLLVYSNKVAFVNNVEVSGSLNVVGGITGSLLGTASYANNSTSASYAATASIQYVSNSLENALNQIEVLDYDSNTAVTFIDGRLKFIFGTPASPSSVAAATVGFATDRFNQVTDNYTVNGSWSNGGYTIISASLYEGTTLLTQVSAGTSLTYNTTTSGSHTYQLQYTASSPLDATLYKTAVTTTNTLSKVNPGSPTITPTATIQLGVASNQIEQGATGSITFTSASGASNSWVFNYIGTTVPSPLTVTGSATGSSSIAVTATSYYSSSGVNGSDNSPALTTTTSTTTTYTKIRSLRYGASDTGSYTAAQLENLALWDSTLGGSVGTIAKGTTTASGQSVTITWTGDKYHYIAYNSSLASLTNITAAGFGVLSAFTLTTIGSYKVYRTTVLQAGGSGTSITYVLT